ncbi:transglutaminase domain-containing protein [Paenibacillus sp. 23TSA30-6]|uniref:transglutaminase domain-containing protein n=1 Tax=Paenibacillus sp. 23TSA30-6 TaxID=2546104 RepID=UPI0017879E48|nr:transglutaminase domain-containing protein [Paenibacillus sp. 23TSA30-6]MBE0338004.1 transglutaminase domain-containing protein [Paenibacillus sp. 23TSA30-6]
MRKRSSFLLILVFLLSIPLHTTAFAAESQVWLNQNNVNHGIVNIRYPVKSNVKTKIVITKDAEKYSYYLNSSKPEEAFALQMGNGNYNIRLLEQLTGNQYKVIGEETVQLNLNDSKTIYLSSIQNIDWNDTNQAIRKAKELTKGATTDDEKVKRIYEYVISHIKYDSNQPFSLSPDYLPQIDRTLVSQKDICYGYASLFAAMLRSVDVPTKLVMGESSYVNTYHAWNEVNINNQWVIIDTTVDAALKSGKQKFAMVKEPSKYTKTKQY